MLLAQGSIATEERPSEGGGEDRKGDGEGDGERIGAEELGITALSCREGHSAHGSQ